MAGRAGRRRLAAVLARELGALLGRPGQSQPASCTANPLLDGAAGADGRRSPARPPECALVAVRKAGSMSRPVQPAGERLDRDAAAVNCSPGLRIGASADCHRRRAATRSRRRRRGMTMPDSPARRPAAAPVHGHGPPASGSAGTCPHRAGRRPRLAVHRHHDADRRIEEAKLLDLPVCIASLSPLAMPSRP